MRNKILLCLGLVVLTIGADTVLGQALASRNSYARWKNGPPHDETFFPIAVWLQPPGKARQYLAAGFKRLSEKTD